MSREIRDHRQVARVLRRVEATECPSAGPEVAAWLASNGTSLGLEFLAAGRPLGSLETSPAFRAFVSGAAGVEAVLALAPEPELDADLRAVVAATSVRALRDVLLAIPRGVVCVCCVLGTWPMTTVTEIVDGHAVEAVERLGFLPRCRFDLFVGVKRGSARSAARAEVVVLTRRDPIVAAYRELADARGRRARSQFVAEGITLVRRAIDDGLPVDSLVHGAELVSAGEGPALLSEARRAGIPCYRASDGLMGTLTATRPVPPAIAAVHLALRDASTLPQSAAPVVLVAEGLQNPDNLGMVLRTADAAGAEAVVVAGSSVDPLHRNCVRAARGAVGRIPVFTCEDPVAWLGDLRSRGFHVAGATGQGETSLYESSMRSPAVVVVGNEESGISPPVLRACSERVRIPMAPGQDSLNVGVAAGILLYELVRREGALGAGATDP